MWGKFSCKGFVKVSDNPRIKVLASALFSSSLIDQRKSSMMSYFCDGNNSYLYCK